MTYVIVTVVVCAAVGVAIGLWLSHRQSAKRQQYTRDTLIRLREQAQAANAGTTKEQIERRDAAQAEIRAAQKTEASHARDLVRTANDLISRIKSNRGGS